MDSTSEISQQMGGEGKQEMKDEERMIPYIVHESALMRAEKTIKRLTIISIQAQFYCRH